MSKWFLQFDGQVKGPFSNETLQSTLDGMNHDKLDDALVWRRGLTEWVRASKWKPELEIPQAAQQQSYDTGFEEKPKRPDFTTPTAASEKTKSVSTDLVSYKVQVNFIDQPNMTKPELLQFLAKQADITKVSIQNPLSKEWSDVYGFPEFVERLGISRRKHPRVPILATFAGHINNSTEASIKVITISEGGMGFTENFDLKIGDQVEGQILSPHFFQPIHVKAEVIYSGQDGYIGLKFTEINDESKAAIIGYIKKFGKALN